MLKSMFVNVIIVTMNRSAYLRNCLESVKKQTYSFYDITVIDNQSIDNTVQMLENDYPEINRIILDRNLGCPGARNIGILNTSGEILFFVDDDGLLAPGVLETVVNEMSKEADIGAVVCSIKEDGRWLIRPDESNNQERIYLGEFKGQGAIRRQVFQQLGLYPTQFLYGAEETDLTFRMLDNGFKIVFQPSALTYHFRTNLARTQNQEIEKARNHFCVILKYIPSPLVYFWGFKRLLMIFILGFKNHQFFKSLNCLFQLPITVIPILVNRKKTVVRKNTVILRELLLSKSVSDYSKILSNKEFNQSLWIYQIKKITQNLITLKKYVEFKNLFKR